MKLEAVSEQGPKYSHYITGVHMASSTVDGIWHKWMWMRNMHQHLVIFDSRNAGQPQWLLVKTFSANYLYI